MEKEVAMLCDRLVRLQSATVGDVLDEMGFRDQVLSHEICGLDRNMRVAGPAFCIKGENAEDSTVEASGDKPKPSFEMFREMYKGCVVVLDTGGHDIGGPWGENSALSAKVRGCVGIVIDGGTRDKQQLIEMGFPTFAEYATPARVEGRWTHVAFQVPIAMPGQTGKEVVVRPGDLILADTDGVVVVPKEVAEQVIEAAEKVTEIEEQIRQELSKGVDREEVYRKHRRYAHIKKIKE